MTVGEFLYIVGVGLVMIAIAAVGAISFVVALVAESHARWEQAVVFGCRAVWLCIIAFLVGAIGTGLGRPK